VSSRTAEQFLPFCSETMKLLLHMTSVTCPVVSRSRQLCETAGRSHATPVFSIAGMHARLLLRANLAPLTAHTCVSQQAQVVLQQHKLLLRHIATNTAPGAAKVSTKSSSSGSGFNKKHFVLYPAAAAVALTSVAAVQANQQPGVQKDDEQSSLLDAQWVQRIPEQQDVLQVLSAKSIETHPLLRQDHIVSQTQVPC